jgi:glutamate synthase domain-containing protein 2/glutamate synthase domain-containing protein 1/glutamate synthase domain-containing protein 3
MAIASRQSARASQPTLYDSAFEHDACGIGFVADAGGRSADRVLPLALAGLAALGHRGAFAADGESSDGAGMSLPLEPALVDHLAPGLGGRRPAIIQAFLPRSRKARDQARSIAERALAASGLSVAWWRAVPHDPSALGTAARASMPVFEQAVVPRPDRTGERAFERALIVARRRIERWALEAGLEDISIASASSRSIVYKGLVDGRRLSKLFPDLAASIPLRYALFHQRYATNTHPVWKLAQPFRSIAHNGEINTVRGNRQQVQGRAADGALSGAAQELVEAGPLLSAGASDSLSYDEALELLQATGWDLPTALLATIPEALPVRLVPHPQVASLQRRTAGFLAPWDGPAAMVFADGRRVGALLDRNGLRPVAFAMTSDRLVAVASEAGAIPLSAAETVRRGRLGPGQILLVDPGRHQVLEDAEAKVSILARLPIHDAPRPPHDDRPQTTLAEPVSDHRLRYLAGLDAERLRLDIKTMTLEAHEPLWSMGDDTPTPGRGRLDRRAADHLRQAFAQVTNPPIDPERERIVMDLRVELGRRPSLLGGPPRGPRTMRLERPIVADLERLLAAFPGPAKRLDATWDAAAGPSGLAAALERLAADAVRLARGRTELLVLSDRHFSFGRLPVPSVLAVGAVHTALTRAGLRGRADILAATSDVFDVHSMAMTLAVGATAVHPWLAIELAAEHAGTRGAEELTREDAVRNLVSAFDLGLRKTLARMGISAIASYIGGALFDTIELAPNMIGRCFPAAAAWPGRVTLADLAERQLRRIEAAKALPEPLPGREARLPDPGFARFRGDGEAHLYAPRIVGAVQELVSVGGADGGPIDGIDHALASYRETLGRSAAVVRDDIRIRKATVPAALADVESASSIARRFVVSAMSVGALSPEAHQALTIGIQRAGGAANTGEGGEDPAWYHPGPDGRRHDARIKQVASARFGVTAQYLARADQLEIKIAQGSKPGEGGQLPGRKATAYIAALRRAQPGQSLISPPPHHDIYSIEDLAQLIADLRAINPSARIGVKLVASRGVGTIAAGVAKAGANYIHLSGHSGGTGASPLSSIKHAGAPWELGLSEVHQVLLRNGLRDRVALRTDGGLQTGRDLLMAALLGAEEFAFGTAMLVAVGCDMARQCHLDTCPTGVASQREDLRAKFAGTPEQVEQFALALAEDFRRELAAIAAHRVGEVVGEGRRYLLVGRAGTHDLRPVLSPSWDSASAARRDDPAMAAKETRQAAASPLEERLVAAFRGQAAVEATGLRLTTADRSFGAALSGAIERGELRGPVRIELHGSAGQSFGAFTTSAVQLRLVGQANDYVGKGLSGGRVVIVPEPDLGVAQSSASVAGNTCLYGATGGRLHLVGRAGMRFAVRNSGAEAVVEGVGPHGCEYMTGGVVVILGPVGANLGAGMTGGHAYLYDPPGRHAAALHGPSVEARRLAEVVASDEAGADRLAEFRRLVEDHAAAGSQLASRVLQNPSLADDVWLVEPVAAVTPTAESVREKQPTPLVASTREVSPAA